MVGFEDEEEEEEEEEIYNQDKQPINNNAVQQVADTPVDLDKRAKMERVL
jgi:hypothetical protein